MPHAPAQQRGERLRAVDERGEQLVAVLAVGVVGERGDVLPPSARTSRRGWRSTSGSSHVRQRSSRASSASAGSRGASAASRRSSTPRSSSPPALVGLEVAGEDRPHRRAAGLGALLGEEQPVGGVLERGGALEAGDAVVADRALERGHEAVGQALGARVERAQEGVQVLLRAAHQLLVVVGVRAVERAHVGVDAEQPLLALAVGGRCAQLLDDPARLARRDVVAEHEPGQALEAADVGLGVLERHALAFGRGRRVLERLDLQQRAARDDVHVGSGEHLPHAAVDRRRQRRLHLHALGHGHHVAGLHLVALADRDRHHHAGRVAADEAALVARDAMGHAVDLDEQVGVLQRGQRAVGAAAERQAVLVGGELLDLRLDAGAVDLDLVAARARPGRRSCGSSRRGAGGRSGSRRWPPPPGARGGRARRSGPRSAAVASSQRAIAACTSAASAWRTGCTSPCACRRSSQPVSTSPERSSGRSSSSSRKPWLVVPSSSVTIMSATARRRRAIACSRVAPWAMILAIIESNSGGTESPSATPRVDADAGPGGQAQQRDAARRGGEAERRVLGVQAHLDRVSARRRRVALEPPAGRDVQLEGDEVDARHDLRHGVLDLQPRVDLHEREALIGGLVEELGGARAAVADLAREPDRGLGQLPLLRGGERRAGRLLDHLLVAALVAAVAHAERPHGALAVGQELDLDVARSAHEALHQHARVAERLLGLGAGALERRGQLGEVLDPAHAAAAAAGRRLDHQRHAEALALLDRLLDGLDRPAAPGRDRNAGLLGQLLGLDLVAQRAHDVGVGADEDDPEAVAQLSERRMLGDEAPADPRGVRLVSR